MSINFLWRLLTLKDAGKFEDYTVDVRHAYIDIMNKTKAHLNEKGKLTHSSTF